MQNLHKLTGDGPPGDLSLWKWACSCGQWQSGTPKIGPWGKTTAKAKIAQVKMAHAKHVKFAIDSRANEA